VRVLRPFVRRRIRPDLQRTPPSVILALYGLAPKRGTSLEDPTTSHIPVMLKEVLDYLDIQPGAVLVDGTLGGGGHTRALAEAVGVKGHVWAFDRDATAVEQAREELASYPVTPVHASYEAIPEVLEASGIPAVHGILLDLGLSSDQLADRSRGFSFRDDGPLDMRFDTSEGPTGADLLARASEKELADIFYHFGEERYSRRIARQIVLQRRQYPVKTAGQLADIVRRSVPSRGHTRIDPSTRTFQALRIAVNDELALLERTLKRIPNCLFPGGRLVVISFHSLEDRLVKSAFRQDERFENITRKPIRPTAEETSRNPRSRSAKLRAARKTTNESS
jgi:16S rRNA (cytosine1402-N4)-methyltransferase